MIDLGPMERIPPHCSAGRSRETANRSEPKTRHAAYLLLGIVGLLGGLAIFGHYVPV